MKNPATTAQNGKSGINYNAAKSQVIQSQESVFTQDKNITTNQRHKVNGGSSDLSGGNQVAQKREF